MNIESQKNPLILNIRKDSLTSISMFFLRSGNLSFVRKKKSHKYTSLQTLTHSHQNNHCFFKRRYIKQSNHMHNKLRPYPLCSTKTPNHIPTKTIITWSFEIRSIKNAFGYCPGLHVEKTCWNQTFRPKAMVYWCHFKTSVAKLPNDCVY